MGFDLVALQPRSRVSFGALLFACPTRFGLENNAPESRYLGV